MDANPEVKSSFSGEEASSNLETQESVVSPPEVTEYSDLTPKPPSGANERNKTSSEATAGEKSESSTQPARNTLSIETNADFTEGKEVEKSAAHDSEILNADEDVGTSLEEGKAGGDDNSSGERKRKKPSTPTSKSRQSKSPRKPKSPSKRKNLAMASASEILQKNFRPKSPSKGAGSPAHVSFIDIHEPTSLPLQVAVEYAVSAEAEVKGPLLPEGLNFGRLKNLHNYLIDTDIGREERVMQDLSCLDSHQLLKKARETENLAFRLSLDEAKELSLGETLKIIKSRSS
mmetsp:Transcript_2027/g.2317  ORF Transcript_2027/g.2317 Transcript_2027/m.2317 type:complete len:289 (+) Transcript_2027:172-1038(+)